MADADKQQNERDPETLALYVEESLEGLQKIEELLLQAERGHAPDNLMDTMFRTVHTIKGTAGYLAYARTQSLSHAAEDLLSRLRDKRIVAGPAHFGILVAVGDKLRQMVESVRQTNEEGEQEIGSLIVQLRAALREEQPMAAQAPSALTSSDAAATAKQPPPPPAVEQASPNSSDVAPSASELAASATTVLAAGKTEGPDASVRVPVAVLDKLMNLIGELVLARNQMLQTVKDTHPAAQGVFNRLNSVTSELQEQVMKTRMQPVARVFEKIPRMVRDVARVTNKEVTTLIEGNATEIDKALVEAIRDPVMHIVRNAIDHGIEAPEDRKRQGKPSCGTLFVRAAHKGGAVSIEVEDDGKGMDPATMRAHAVKKGILTAADAARLSDREAVELVFRPGFSTAAAVTDISGRGVGMDVVRTHVERAGGHAEIESTPGKGSIIRLKMPLTMAIIPALLVRAKNQRFAIPQVNLLELVYLNGEQQKKAIEQVRGAAIFRLRGEIVPLVYLREVLGLASKAEQDVGQGTNIVVLAIGSRRYGLIVDEVENTEEIVIKPLQGQLKRLTCYSGATVLGDGSVAMILDASGVAARAGMDMTQVGRRAAAAAEGPDAAGSATESMLVFRAGQDAHCAVPLALVARLEEVSCAVIERVATTEVMQYRGQLLPIVRPEALLPLGERSTPRVKQSLVVFDFGHPIAMAVEEIMDVAQVPHKQTHCNQDTAYAHGKAVIFGKTTLLLDVPKMLQVLAPRYAGVAAGLQEVLP